MPTIAIVLKGYPRLSETFIAQEIKALQDRGLDLQLISLRHPTDPEYHPIHSEIRAPVNYLPEYLYQEPWRVLRGLGAALFKSGFAGAFKTWIKDLRRDFSPNRIRRFGQAMVLARELGPDTRLIYAHFLHTPGSVARYTSILTGLPWSFSAHAKDIWTLEDWEKREKLADCKFGVTCTAGNHGHLQRLSPRPDSMYRVYHGLDFSRFEDPGPYEPVTDTGANKPIQILSVGRAVAKKGYGHLLEALSMLPDTIRWNFVHIGGGPDLDHLQYQATELGISQHIEWLGAQAQKRVLRAYREADLFVLASVIDKNGDRDGLPNVLMEAQSQRLCCIATSVSGIPELIQHDLTGLLVEPANPQQLCAAIEQLAIDPQRRHALANQGLEYLKENFSLDREIDRLVKLLTD